MGIRNTLPANNDFPADEMKNEVLTERLRFFKETEEGQEKLSEIDARSVAKGKAEGRAEEKLSMVTKLISTNAVPLEYIASASGLSIDELKKIKNSLLNLA